jgi:hypothetical protein
MVSGIGPPDQLQEHGINVIANRPGVGQNMWDHPFFAPSYRVRVTTFTEFATNLPYAAGQAVEALVAKNGFVTNPIADFLAWEKIPLFLRTAFSGQTHRKLAGFPSDWPEAEAREIFPQIERNISNTRAYSTCPAQGISVMCQIS